MEMLEQHCWVLSVIQRRNVFLTHFSICRAYRCKTCSMYILTHSALCKANSQVLFEVVGQQERP